MEGFHTIGEPYGSFPDVPEAYPQPMFGNEGLHALATASSQQFEDFQMPNGNMMPVGQQQMPGFQGRNGMDIGSISPRSQSRMTQIPEWTNPCNRGAEVPVGMEAGLADRMLQEPGGQQRQHTEQPQVEFQQRMHTHQTHHYSVNSCKLLSLFRTLFLSHLSDKNGEMWHRRRHMIHRLDCEDDCTWYDMSSLSQSSERASKQAWRDGAIMIDDGTCRPESSSSFTSAHYRARAPRYTRHRPDD